MSLKINLDDKGGSKFEPISVGLHVARLVSIIDLGTQIDEFQGEKSVRPKAFLTFETPGETLTVSGKAVPKTVNLEVTVSGHPKSKLTTFVKAMITSATGDIELKDLLGKSLRALIGRTSGGKAKIASVLPCDANAEVPKSDTKLEFYSIEQGEDEVFLSLPPFVQEKIRSSVGYVAKTAAKSSGKRPLI